jgi:hypothetical protein
MPHSTEANKVAALANMSFHRSVAAMVYLVAFLSMGFSAFQALGAAPVVEGSYRFVEDVLLISERGTNVKRCRRFVDSPSVALLWGQQHQTQFDDAVKTINEALAPTKFSLRTMLPASAEVQVKCFYAGGPADYARIRQSYWLQTPPDAWTWDVSWDAYSRLTKGFVLINIQGCDDETIRYRSIRALLGAIGVNGWSSAVRNSIFSGQSKSLTPADRRLINFFYGHVSPNAQAWELRNAFDQFWAKD